MQQQQAQPLTLSKYRVQHTLLKQHPATLKESLQMQKLLELCWDAWTGDNYLHL